MCKYCQEKLKIEKIKDKDGNILRDENDNILTEAFTIVDGTIVNDQDIKHKKSGDYTQIQIKRPPNVKKTRLYVDNGYGLSYIDINYCFMCGRKLDGNN